MQTILVPIRNVPAMKSTLETAVLLAQRTRAYVEGVPLWFGVPEFVVAEMASTLSIETYRARRDEETAGAPLRDIHAGARYCCCQNDRGPTFV